MKVAFLLLSLLAATPVLADFPDDSAMDDSAMEASAMAMSHELSPSSHSEMESISIYVIEMVDELEGYTNYRDYGLYLLPVKKAAARSVAAARSYGDLSGQARRHYLNLLRSLDRAAPWIDNSFEMKRAFHLTVELLAQREWIRRALQ
ncbi:MAG: hypothetical protein HUU37_05080 [Bdellovibrionales bacterium]|nr:hypothetical protein [Bdellovibrionales bacterium]